MTKNDPTIPTLTSRGAGRGRPLPRWRTAETRLAGGSAKPCSPGGARGTREARRGSAETAGASERGAVGRSAGVRAGNSDGEALAFHAETVHSGDGLREESGV